MTSEEERERERKALSSEESREKELKARGVIFPELGALDRQTLEDIVRLSAVARTASVTEVAVRVFKEGRLQEVVQPIGQYDVIFQALLYRRMQGRER